MSLGAKARLARFHATSAPDCFQDRIRFRVVFFSVGVRFALVPASFLPQDRSTDALSESLALRMLPVDGSFATTSGFCSQSFDRLVYYLPATVFAL